MEDPRNTVTSEKVERVIETGEGGQDTWFTATATDAEIPPEALLETRLVGFHFWQEASIVQGGVMPVPNKDASEPSALIAHSWSSALRTRRASGRRAVTSMKRRPKCSIRAKPVGC